MLTTYARFGLLSLWGGAALLAGGVVTSLHQPFQAPDASVAALAPEGMGAQWAVVHVLSGSCACSQRVMRHLIERRRLDGVVEQVVLVDDAAPYLPESAALVAGLERADFPVRHLAAKALPKEYGIRGVPLLLVVSPAKQVAYAGGYGADYNQDSAVLRQLRSGHAPPAIPILGCAVGRRVRQQADPLGWKY